VFENRVLGRIFGLKRCEVTGGLRTQHSEELPCSVLFTKLRYDCGLKEDEVGEA
jgi:hypothetical protein